MSCLDEIGFTPENIKLLFQSKSNSMAQKFDVKLTFKSILTIGGKLPHWIDQLLVRGCYDLFIMFLLEYYLFARISKVRNLIRELLTEKWDLETFRKCYLPRIETFPFLDYFYGKSDSENEETALYCRI